MFGYGRAANLPANAWTYTPVSTGELAVKFQAGCYESPDNYVSAQIMYGTGTAPVTGGGLTGVSAQYSTQVFASTGVVVNPLTLEGLISGLALGQLYWFDIAMTGNGTASSVQVNSTGNPPVFSVLELAGGAGATGPMGVTGPSGGPTGPQGMTGPTGSTAIPINAVSTSYTTTASDGGNTIQQTVSGNTTTIAANSSVGYNIGTTISFYAASGINTTIAINSDTLTFLPGGGTGARTLTGPGLATAYKVGTTSWVISGTGLS
jgi:hypothetical protein